VLLVTGVLTLLSFAVSLLLGILAIILMAKLHGTSPDLRMAYREIALPAACVAAAVVLVATTFVELRHYRRAKMLRHIERQIGPAS